MEGLVCTYMGNNMASLMGSKAAIPAKASARTLSTWGTFSIVHSPNRCRVSLTFVRYRVMRSSLAPYSSYTCLTTSWEWLQILSLETDSVSAMSNSNRMASYSASLFNVGNPKWMACSSCSPIGDYSSSPTPDPNDREVPSTCKVHHSALSNSPSQAGRWEDSTTKLAITCHFMDSLDQYSIPYSLNSMAHWSILLDRSGLCGMLRRDWSVSMTIKWPWKYGRSFWAALRKAKAVCSIFEYLISASVIALLT